MNTHRNVFLMEIMKMFTKSCESHIKKESLKCKLLINMQYIFECYIKRLNEYQK